MTFEQSNVALVGLKIQVKNRTEDGYAADDRIERDVASILATTPFPAPCSLARMTM